MNVDVRLSSFGRERVPDLAKERAEERADVYDSVRTAVEKVLNVRTRSQRVKPVRKIQDPGRIGGNPLSPASRGSDSPTQATDLIRRGQGRMPGSQSIETVPVGEVMSVTTLDVDVDELRDELVDAVLEEIDDD